MAQQAAAKQAPPPAAPTMTIEAALKIIEQKAPDAFPVLSGVVRKDVVTLGVDEIFTLRDKDGDIKAFKQVCRLSIQNGGLVSIPVGGGTPIISAEGYEMWAEKAGASVIFPTEVLVFGKPMSNPAPLSDPATGKWSGWVVRAVAFRFSSMGIPQVSDRTVVFDVNVWKNIDFLGKAKDAPQAFKVLPKGHKVPEEQGAWIEYPFDEAASLWVKADHPEALKWYSDVSQRIKNSLQLAQTHAARNALKHLSGLQKSPGRAPVWDIPVIAWRPVSGSLIKWDTTTYKNLQQKVSGLIGGDRSEFKQIALSSGTDHIGPEDMAGVPEGDFGEPGDQAPIDVDGKANGAAPPLSAEEQKILNNLAVARQEFPAEFEAACQTLQISPDAELTVDQAAAIMAEVNRIVDSAA